MTTLPLVSTGAPTSLQDLPPAPTATPAGPNVAHDAPPVPTGGAPFAHLRAPHELHPLAQQQVLYADAGGAAGATNPTALPRGVPDAATRKWDVHGTSQADIDALKRSLDPQQVRLGHTIENAKAAYGDLLGKNGGRIVVTMNAGNGGEPVMTLMAKGFDPKLPVRVHTHYHGDNATVGDPEGSKAGQNSRIRATQARDPQMVFILPECQNAKPTPDGPKHNLGYPANWGNVKSQAETTDLALAAADIPKRKLEQETVSVHSRGGEVIEMLMKNDPSGNSLRANRLELHDSLYGSPDDVAKWGRTDNGRQVEKVIYVQGTNIKAGYGHDQEIRKVFKGAYIRIDVASHAPPPPAPGTTPPAVRPYHPDPHYQTTGRYLAIWPLPN